MTTESTLVRYYAQRAHEYEQVYRKPERQQDILRLRAHLRQLFVDHTVLEVACGTGYWTEAIATTATTILATDINDEVLTIARMKTYSKNNVQFVQDDAFTLASITRTFTAGFAGFWWSHVLKAQLPQFLDVFHAKLGSGALVVFVDNRYVEGSNHRITRIDADGNTYQQRQLENGTAYEVLKNFPDEVELQHMVTGSARNVRYEQLTSYWCLSYTLN